jgi:hypothetical protein
MVLPLQFFPIDLYIPWRFLSDEFKREKQHDRGFLFNQSIFSFLIDD